MIARVRWELEVTRGYRRNPQFYVDQTLGALVDALLPPPPFGARRSADILARLSAFPRVLEEAKANLDDARALPSRAWPSPTCRAWASACARRWPTSAPASQPEAARALGPAADKAARALEDVPRPGWRRACPPWATESAVGREAYVFFLREVALVPLLPGRAPGHGPAGMGAIGGLRGLREEPEPRPRPSCRSSPTRRPRSGPRRRTRRAVRDFLARRACSPSPTRCRTTCTGPCPATCATSRASGNGPSSPRPPA